MAAWRSSRACDMSLLAFVGILAPAQVQVVIAPMDIGKMVEALAAALPDAEARLRFSQAMGKDVIDVTPADAAGLMQ